METPAREPPAAPSGSLGFDPRGLDRVRSVLRSYIDAKRYPGFSALVARRGRVVLSDLSGWQDPAARIPMAPDTIFRIYSMTKPVVCSAFLTLLDEGRVSLEDPVSRYLPAFSKPRVLAGGTPGDARLEDAARPILVRNLLTHTSGLTYGFLDDSPVCALYRESAVMNDAGRSLGRMVEEAARLPLAFHPGERWGYGVNIDVIGRLIEVISGRGLGEFLAERIFSPLGMEDTGFHVPEGKRSRIAAMYGNPDITTTTLSESFRAWKNGYYERIDVEGTYPSDRPSFARGGHGLFTTTNDFFRFAQALLDRGRTPDGRRILRPGTVDRMRTNHLPASLLPFELAGVRMRGYGFGLGCQVLQDPEAAGVPSSPGEYGWNGAAKTCFWVDPAREIVAVLMTQYMSGFDYPENEFKDRVYGALAGNGKDR